MHTVRIDYPEEWERMNVYTLADLHIGDQMALDAEIKRRFDEIANDPCGVCVLNGDLMNTALKNSVSDVYAEKLTPMQQIARLVEMLRPIQGKIVAATTGNHEQRAYRDDGIDIMRLVCRELGIENRYDPCGVLVFVRFGEKNGHERHKGKHTKRLYTIYATHGSGGGRKEGAKAIRLADMASIVDADCYIHSHTHMPMVMKQDYYRTSASNSSVDKVERTFVNTASAMDYGGYGQAAEFKPSSISNPVIHLYARDRRVTVTL